MPKSAVVSVFVISGTQQNNPKRTGSSAHKRYELYKRAKTRDEFKSLGGCSADFTQDLRKGYVVLS